MKKSDLLAKIEFLRTKMRTNNEARDLESWEYILQILQTALATDPQKQPGITIHILSEYVGIPRNCRCTREINRYPGPKIIEFQRWLHAGHHRDYNSLMWEELSKHPEIFDQYCRIVRKYASSFLRFNTPDKKRESGRLSDLVEYFITMDPHPDWVEK